ncbi:hypothetical protein AB0393_38705 [Streptomyces cyaneofuscatus]|uniref:hypothetical protein n=1 Tax=Streptomyces cyaneofuscatus TaxID=66883 RepID=UPI00344D1554
MLNPTLADAAYAWMSAQDAPATHWDIAHAIADDTNAEEWNAAHKAVLDLELEGRLVNLSAREWSKVGVTARSTRKGRHRYLATDAQFKAWHRPRYSVMWVSSDFIGETDADAWTRGYALKGVKITGDEYDINGIRSDDWSRYFWTGHARNAADAYAQGFLGCAYDVWDRSDFEVDAEEIAEMVARVHVEFVDDDTSDPAYVTAIVRDLQDRRAAEVA